MGDLIADAQSRAAIPDVTLGFGDSVDSRGETWDDSALSVTVRRGQPYRKVAEYFASLGYDWSVTDTLRFDMWNRRGTDFTGFDNSPMVRTGKLVGGKLTRKVPGTSAVFVEGQGGLYLQGVDVTDVLALGRREAYVIASQASDPTALAGIAINTLNDEDARQSAIRLDMIASPNATPFLDFDIGDQILVDIPGKVPLAEYPEGFRVIAISARLELEEPVYTVDLNWMVLEQEAAVAAGLRKLMEATGERSVSPGKVRGTDTVWSSLLSLTSGVTGSQTSSTGSGTGDGHTHPTDPILVGDAATGDLAGNYPAPTVNGIRGVPVSATPGSGDDQKVLVYDETNNEWDLAAQSGSGGSAGLEDILMLGGM